MITVKLSYSILSTWARYQYEQAVGMYLGQPLPKTPQMELGSTYDKLWTQYIDKHKALPAELGGGELKNPRTQLKLEKYIPVNEDIQILLRGVLDVADEDTILEFKCGMTEASQYVDMYQADYYKLLYPQARLADYRCYNPYFNTHTRGIKFLGRGNAEAALNHLYTHGTELIDYLQANKLLRDYNLTIKKG